MTPLGNMVTDRLHDETVWIGSPHPFDLHEAYLDFRSPPSWVLSAAPGAARLLITADSRYRLWINGRFVARGPARSYPQAQSVDDIDVTAYLRPGRNVLAAQVYQPGYSHFAYVHRGAAGLLAQLEGDGQLLLATGSTWRARRNPSFDPNVPRISIYGSGVEERRLRREDDWTDPAYDDGEWDAARVVATPGRAPWNTLQPRALPLLQEKDLLLPDPEMRLGPAPETSRDDAHRFLRQGWATARPVPIPRHDDGWYAPALQEGRCAYWLFDLGRDVTCQAWVEIEGAGGQETLSISYAEKKRDGDLVLSDPDTYCRVRMTDRFYLRPGDQVAEPFALRGARYLLLQLTGPIAPNFRLRPHIRASHYPLQITRPLDVDDPLLDEVIAMCERTVQACLQDGFIDCTWREAAQWVGDALPQSLSLWAMSGDLRPLRRVIEMAAQGAYDDGVLPGVLPGEVHAYVVVDYNFTWVELLSLYHELSGDEAFVRDLWPVLRKMLGRFHQDRRDDGLILSQTGRRLFLDWAPLSRREPNAVYNLRYLLALQTASALARALGHTDDAQTWQARAERLQKAVRDAFWRDGRWNDDEQGNTYSQLSTALALLTETATPQEAPALQEAIIARSLDDDDVHVVSDEHTAGEMVLNSPFMHHYIFEALRAGGREDAVLGIIRRRWGRWAQAGEPTTWENWNVDFPDGSVCHAFSAHPRYHLAMILDEELQQDAVAEGARA